jgi:cysteinyl-tRNA synthetase
LELAFSARQRFLEKMDDDFNTGGAIAELFDLVRELNKFADQHRLDQAVDPRDPQVAQLVEGTRVLRELTNILGLFRSLPPVRGGDEGLLPRVMELVIALRAEARARKDFATADRIRDALAGLGIVLEDRKGGATEWRVQSAAASATA